MERQKISQFLKNKFPIIDVRSPEEFSTGHIPNAENIALFDNEERTIVGTTYKKNGKQKAIEEGLGIVGPNLQEFVKNAKKVARDNNLRVYCWRGGMRSEKMAWLFELVGIKCIVLEGGYKAYRNHTLELLGSLPSLILLQGPTGIGKTAILHALKENGEQVIDLEGLANHRGSAFGSLGMPEQPSTLQFQNAIYEEVSKMDTKKRIWIESESLSIGKVYLPEPLWGQMNKSSIIQLSMPLAHRVKRVVSEYGSFDSEKLKEKISRLKRMGGNNVKLALQHLGENNLEAVAELLLQYYDKSYQFGANKYKKNKPIKLQLEDDNPTESTFTLIKLANKEGL